MKQLLPSFRSIRVGVAALVGLLPISLSAQEWQVIDTFDGGAAKPDWSVPPNMALDFSDNSLFFRNVSPNTTQAMSVRLPQAVSSGKLTITFDLYLPAGPVQNQIGFGVGSDQQLTRNGWERVGARNRFQTANPHPQNLVKAEDWGFDLLGPTLQGVWYNIWVVYDVSAETISFYFRRADAEGRSPVFVKSWPFEKSSSDDLSTIAHFVLGAGTLDPAVDGYSALGGVIDNLYMAVGEKLELSPTAKVEAPPSWTAVDTFTGAQPGAQWAGDLGLLDLDFSEGYLFMRGKTGTSRSSIYTELPATMVGGRFTVTFDLYVAGDSSQRTDIGFAAVGDDQIGMTNWDRRGGNDRIGTFGVTPQNLSKAADFGNILIPGAELQGNWYHVWLYYDLAAKTLSFYHTPFGADAPAADAPTQTWVLANNYNNFRYFIVGLDRADNPGLGIGNIYFAGDKLISFSPTAGQFNPGGSGEPPVGRYDDPVMARTWHFGEQWFLWYGADEGNNLGIFYGGFREADGSGWIYHLERAEYLYVYPGFRLLENDLFLYSLERGYIWASATFADNFYYWDSTDGWTAEPWITIR